MPESLLVVPLGKALSTIIPSWCDRQMVGNSLASLLEHFDRFLVTGRKYVTMNTKSDPGLAFSKVCTNYANWFIGYGCMKRNIILLRNPMYKMSYNHLIK